MIFTTDHGAQSPRGKLSIYEGGLRVPYILRWADNVGEGIVKDELISHVDLLSTVMEAAQVSCPNSVAGKSVLPLAKGESVSWRKVLFAEWCGAGPTEYYPQRSVRDERYKLIVNYLKDRPNPSAAHYSSSGKFWEINPTLDEIASASHAMQEVYETFSNPPTEKLYDLDTDPHEFINIADRPDYERALPSKG